MQQQVTKGAWKPFLERVEFQVSAERSICMCGNLSLLHDYPVNRDGELCMGGCLAHAV